MAAVRSTRSIVYSDTTVAVPPNLHWNEVQLDERHPIRAGVNHYLKKTQPVWDIHVGFEMGIILEGKVIRWHGAHKLTLSPGQLWLCKAWEPHGFAVIRPPARVLVITLWPAGLAVSGMADHVDYLQFLRFPQPMMPQARSADQRTNVLRRAQDIIASASADRRGNEKQLLLTRLLLVELLEMRQTAQPPGTSPSGEGSERIAPALRLIQDNPRRRIGLSEAARACHISIPLLVRLFRTMMGTTFGEYERKRRLAGLVAELRDDRMKLDALAKKYGFTDAPHLCRTFKSCFGITPSQYVSDRPDRS